MKKVIFIMTMLVMAMGVSFSTNAQTVVPVYSMNTSDISDWTGNFPNGTSISSGDDAMFQFAIYNYPPTPAVLSQTATMEKGFNMSDLDSVKISYDIVDLGGGSTGPLNYTLNIYISDDGGVTYPVEEEHTYYGNGVSDHFMLYNSSFNLSGQTYVKIEITYENASLGTNLNETINVGINQFDIEGYENAGSVGIDENDLSNTLEVYSFDKSIFLTSNESMNADVTVYNMSGQVVNTQNMNLSYSKSELNLYDVPSGMYIVNVSDGSSVMSKKVFIQ